MSEVAWANQKEWAEEVGELEIKQESPAPSEAICSAKKCSDAATVEIVIGRVPSRYGASMLFCDHHKEDWIDWYSRYVG